MKKLAATLAAAATLLVSAAASASPQLQYVWSCAGNTAGCGGTVIFIHGKADCSSAMGDCNGGNGGTGPKSYWTNSYNGANMLNEATTKYVWDSASGTQKAKYYEAFVIGYDLASQGYWYSANDVGNCIKDLYQGTNASGCNPNLYQRTSFRIVTHSAGGPVIDRLLSTGWYDVNSHVLSDPNNGGTGWSVTTVAPALRGSRASSALYGIDGYSNFCSTLVSWAAGWALKNNGAASLTRSAVTGEAAKGYQGHSNIWINKVVTTGGGGSANNNWNTGVNEHDNDSSMGALAGCLGYSGSDDMDGLLYWSDEDANSSGSSGPGCGGDVTCAAGKDGNYVGSYWHYFKSWANHSHNRDDAYTTLGDWNSTDSNGNNWCYTRSPGTCLAQWHW